MRMFLGGFHCGFHGPLQGLPFDAPRAALIAALFSLLAPLSLWAQDAPPAPVRHYTVERLTVELTVLPQGGYEVRETLSLRFEGGTYREGFREIPTGRLKGLEVVEVMSPDVEVQSFEAEQSRTRTEITWRFPPHEGPARFELTYRVEGALQSVEGRNVVDWDAVGTGWTVPLADVRVHVRIPAFSLEPAAFAVSPEPVEPPSRHRGDSARSEAGPFEGEAPFQWDAPLPWDAISFVFAPGSLPAETPFRVVVSFPEQIAGTPPPPPPGPFEPVGVWVVLSLLAGVAFPGAVAFSFRTRRPAVQSQGLGPSLLHPAWLARLEGRTYWADVALPATLVRLAREGALTLSTRGAALEKGSDEVADLVVTVHGSHEGLLGFERDLLEGLAETPSYRTFRAEQADRVKQIHAQVEEELTRAGLLESKADRVRIVQRLGATLAVLAPISAILPAVRALPGAVPGMIAVFGVVGGLGLILTGMKTWALTAQGEEARARHLAYMRQLRRGILDDLRRRPERAEAAFLGHLEGLLVSGAHDPLWMTRASRAFRKAGVSPALPAWIRSGSSALSGGRASEAGANPDPLQSLAVYRVLWSTATPGGLEQSAAGSQGATMGAGGVGMSGGFGGGGGGFR